jgi:hypothetical protein
VKQAVSDKSDSGTTRYQEDDEVGDDHLAHDSSYAEVLQVAPTDYHVEEKK